MRGFTEGTWKCLAVCIALSAVAESIAAPAPDPGVPTNGPGSIYKRLITTKNGMYVDPTNFTRTFLNGEVQEEVVTEPQWQSTPWTAPYGRTVTNEPCPVPDIAGFFATHWTDAALATRPTSTNSFDFSGLGGGAVHYIKTAVDPNPAGDDYSVFVGYSEPEVTIDVTNSGTVVWMLDHGWFSNQHVRVVGTVNDCLVMVSRENRVPSSSPYADKGFDFRSGLHSPNVRLILVSDSAVKIDHAEGPEYSGMDLVINYLSIFAGHVWFSGPEATYSQRMILSHDPNSAHDAPGGLIDQLNELGALPNSDVPVPIRETTWGRVKLLYRQAALRSAAQAR